jgi:hypothetical protein
MIAFWITIGFLILFGIIFGLATRYGKNQRRRQIDKLREKLNGSPVRDQRLLGYRRSMPAFDIELDGRKLTLGITFANKLQLCAVEVKRDKLPLIVFRRERGLDRLGRWLFLNREVQTGDNGFDAEVYIETDEEEYLVKRTLETPQARDAVSAAVAQHRAIILSKEGVGGTVFFSQDLDKTVAAIRAALQPLGRIADELPSGDPMSGARGERSTARGDFLALAMLIGMVPSYFELLVMPDIKPDRFEPWMNAAQKSVERAGVLAFLAFLLISFVWIRGHSRSLRNFLMTAIFGFMVVPFGVIQNAYLLNALLDHSPVVEHGSVVSKKSSTSTRHHTYYHLTFPSIFSQGTAGMDIDRATWKTISVGDRIVLGMRSGRFGWLWVDYLRKDFDAPPAQPQAAQPSPAPTNP